MLLLLNQETLSQVIRKKDTWLNATCANLELSPDFLTDLFHHLSYYFLNLPNRKRNVVMHGRGQRQEDGLPRHVEERQTVLHCHSIPVLIWFGSMEPVISIQVTQWERLKEDLGPKLSTEVNENTDR